MEEKKALKKVRVRMAPSPTGMMHIGTLRTVLYDYLFAHQSGGDFVLRIEDTDQAREVEGAVENLLTTLAWAGLEPDEGPRFDEEGNMIEVGEYGPYTQSKRLDIYTEHIEKLVASGKAYRCFCSSVRLDEMRSLQQKMKQPPMYDRTCANLETAEVQRRMGAGEKSVVRMNVPRGREIIVEDIVRGRVSFSTDTVDDQVIMKSDGFPTYHLAVVVDDHMMQISHILRGEEWLPSTPKHILLYEMFGWDVPLFAHLPLLLGSDGKKKLSKRDGDVSVEDFIAQGYLREAIINFVAFLGWNPGGGQTQEIYSIKELQEVFHLDKVHKSGAILDRVKLGKINAHYIKALSIDELYDIGISFFDANVAEMYPSWQTKYSSAERELATKRIMKIEQERLEKLSDFTKENAFFFADIEVDFNLLQWKENSQEETQKALCVALELLSSIDDADWTRENLQVALMEAAGDDRGGFLWPLRAALTGQKKSPSPMDCAWALGKEATIKRLKNVCDQ